MNRAMEIFFVILTHALIVVGLMAGWRARNKSIKFRF